MRYFIDSPSNPFNPYLWKLNEKEETFVISSNSNNWVGATSTRGDLENSKFYREIFEDKAKELFPLAFK